MNKIAVIGPPGAGKTEFANVLGKILRIENIYHLDHYFWKPGWTRTSGNERHAIIEELTKPSEWIIEGNFLDTLDTQFAHADLVIWLNLNPFICFYRVLKRYFSYIGKEIPEIAPGCRDKITPGFLVSIFTYRFIDSKKVKEKLQIPNPPNLKTLKTPKEVSSFLDERRLMKEPR
jgi:adenylate kinase family enzyme